MTDEMEWCHDFCLGCDRQTVDGEPYCSQACRLADLQRACSLSLSPSNLHSPTSTSRTTAHSTQMNSSAGSGFHLPPAVNFAAYKNGEQSSMQSSSAGLHSRSGHGSIGSARAPQSSMTGSSSNSDQRLTPSSSGTSLSSMSSTAKDPVYSEEVRNELMGYFAAFGQSRDWKRRQTFA